MVGVYHIIRHRQVKRFPISISDRIIIVNYAKRPCVTYVVTTRSTVYHKFFLWSAIPIYFYL